VCRKGLAEFRDKPRRYDAHIFLYACNNYQVYMGISLFRSYLQAGAWLGHEILSSYHEGKLQSTETQDSVGIDAASFTN
jgi:hypothetical protein